MMTNKLFLRVYPESRVWRMTSNTSSLSVAYGLHKTAIGTFYYKWHVLTYEIMSSVRVKFTATHYSFTGVTVTSNTVPWLPPF